MAQENVPVELWQEVFNNILQEPAAIVLFFAITAYWSYTTIKSVQENGIAKGSYLSALSFIIFVILPTGFILLTEALGLQASRYHLTSGVTVGTLRWITLYAILCLAATATTYKYSKYKGGIAMFSHISILLFGWMQGRWLGMLLISVPLFGAFYFLLFQYAQIIFPASAPEDKLEKKNKFQAAFWYIWGGQYPSWVATSSATRDLDKRIDGDYFKDFGAPGVSWTHSHQVVGHSAGIEFVKADGPGITFTKQYERPVAIVDLRTQLRPTVFNVVTKDGIEVEAVIFIAFKIDQDDWSDWDKKRRHQVWRASPILQDGLKPDHNIDSCYSYSAARVHAVLSSTSIGAPEENDETPDVYWDQIIVQHVVKEARHVLAGRTFDELWKPKNDKLGASALDEMANAIKERAAPRLQEAGVQLFASRVVNFIIGPQSPLRQRLIQSWQTVWYQRIQSIIMEGDAEASKLIENARVYTRSILLDSIIESLQRARKIHSDMPKHVITLHFIATLEHLFGNAQKLDEKSQKERLEILKEIMVQQNREL